MDYFNDLMLSIIFLLFPILIYLFYIAYNKNISKEEENLFLCLSLFSSIYLILNKNIYIYPRISLYMANILISIAYIRKNRKEAVVLSIFYIIIGVTKYNLILYFLIIEYIIYLIISFINFNDYIYGCICLLIKFIFLLIFDYNLYDDNIYITILITLFSIFLVIYSLKKGENIISYHLSYKELMKERQIKTTLFKITHEIKNPLAVCKGYFDMMDFDDMEKTKKYVRIIRSEVTHALLILSDFSDLSKINIQLEKIDLDSLIDDALSNLNELLDSKNIIINYKGHELIIDGDYKRLMQVFINIIKNSVEAMEDVEKRMLTININEKNSNVLIEFIDTGIGMDKELLNNFQNPFYTTKTNGTGLGTVLSSEIIKAHQGSIKYTSLLNKGTKVIISLPKNNY